MYTVSCASIFAVVVELAPDARPCDGDGVVTITFAIVDAGRLQLVSLTLLKKDISVCRVLVNSARCKM